MFSFAMIGYTPFLLTGADWDALARFATRRKRRLTAYFDAGCGVCFQFVRVVGAPGSPRAHRRSGPAPIWPRRDAGAVPRDVSPELLRAHDRRRRRGSGKTYMRADAVAQILRAFPVGWLWSLPLRLPGLRALANWGYDCSRGGARRSRRSLGLAACALPARPPPRRRAESGAVIAPDRLPSPVAAPPPAISSPRGARRSNSQIAAPAVDRAAGARSRVPCRDRGAAAGHRRRAGARCRSAEATVAALAVAARGAAPALAPFRQQFRTLVWAVREVVVLAFIVTMVSETLYINAAVPKFLKHEQPLWIKRMVAYPRLIQAWSMFASDAPTTDQSMVVDAVTVDGRHVDPYSEATSRYANPGHNEIPERLDNDSFVFNYSGRIPGPGAYHQALTEWILNYHERTGNPRDRIVSFDAYEVDDDSPPIGELKPRNVRSHVFLSYPPKRSTPHRLGGRADADAHPAARAHDQRAADGDLRGRDPDAADVGRCS